MLGSDVLDVAIGLVLVYLLLSLIASTIREGIESSLKSRAATLERGLRELLHDPKGAGFARILYEHPLISGLYRGAYEPDRTHRNLPTYIPARNFAVAIMDIAARGYQPSDAGTGDQVPVLSLASVRAGVTRIENPALQRAILTAIDMAQGDLGRAQANLEAWFDSGMDRTSGWYKRHTQVWILSIATVLTIATNINTFTLVDHLSREKGTREALVARAGVAVRDSGLRNQSTAELNHDLGSLALPIGWDASTHPDVPRSVPWPASITDYAGYGLGALGGWLLTIFAVSLGAPFWFDVLNKFMAIRSATKPDEKSRDESAMYRQPPRETSTIPPVGQSLPPSTVVEGAGFLPHEWKTGDPQEGVL